MRPALLRPPLLLSGRTSDFSGVERVISAKSATDEPRRPGVVGLYLRIPMCDQSLLWSGRLGDRAPEDLDAALAQRDDGALAVGALAEAGPRPLALALPVERVDGAHLDVEDLLDGDLDLRLVGVRPDKERVLVLVEQTVALLGDDRREQDVARVGQVGHAEPSSVVGSASAASVASAAGASTAGATDGTLLSISCGVRSSPGVPGSPGPADWPSTTSVAPVLLPGRSPAKAAVALADLPLGPPAR